jgi:hypothetical protein
MEQQPKYPIGGFAPGYYYCKCCDCGQQFFGDKRAVQCEPCAIKGKEAFEALSPEEQAEMVKRNSEEARNLFIRNHTSAPAVNWDQVKINFDAGMPELEASFQAGYSAGVDMAMKRAVSAPAVDEELRNLRQWKESAMELLRPIDQYTDKHPGIKLGQSKVEFVIDQARKYDDMAASTTQGAVWIDYKERQPEAGDRKLLSVKYYYDHPDLFCSVALTANQLADRVKGEVGRTWLWLDESGSQRQAGRGWVKATQALPTFGQQLFVKFNGSKYLSETYDEAPNDQVPKISFFFDGRHHFEDEYHLIEYLNESTPSKEDAVEFATFLFKYCRRVSYNTLTDVCHYVYNDSLYTTEQLYKLYQQNK